VPARAFGEVATIASAAKRVRATAATPKIRSSFRIEDVLEAGLRCATAGTRRADGDVAYIMIYP